MIFLLLVFFSRIGRVYTKAIFQEYTSDDFDELKMRMEAEEHLGLLGPVIRFKKKKQNLRTSKNPNKKSTYPRDSVKMLNHY